MARICAKWVAQMSARESYFFLRGRAWHFAACGNYAIAADYVIRLLNRRPNDPAGLVLGEIVAKHTRQDTLEAKCVEAQRRLCVRKNVDAVLQLVGDEAERERLRDWLREAPATTERATDAPDEQVVVHETEPLEETRDAVRIMAQRASDSPLVELLHPKQSVYGRGIYAARRIVSGSAVMLDQPFVVQRMRTDVCAHCLAILGRGGGGSACGMPCADCELETYCSAACRDAAWREYHACCCRSRNSMYASWEEAMRERLNAGDAEESRGALGCLAVAKICAMATVQQLHPLALPRIRSLRGRADYDAATALSEVGALAVTLAGMLQQTHLYMEEVLSLFAIVQTNEFLLPGGTALYHGYSLLNHSCEPNCALVGSSATNRQLVTLRDVREGEQLLINYNANLTTRVSYEDRRALCQQRHFECFCPKCAADEVSLLFRCHRSVVPRARLPLHSVVERAMRLSFMARCAPCGSTFTSRLAQLAQRVELLAAAGAGTTATPAAGGVSGLWEEVTSAAKCARALKETDTMLAVVFCLLRCGHHPPLASTWAALIRDLTPYSDIEANSVLAYPGVAEDAADCHGTRTSFPGLCDATSTAVGRAAVTASGDDDDGNTEDLLPLLRPTRETLLLTGGVVPLSARVPCGDGGALGNLLDAFCAAHETSQGGGGGANAVDDACLQDVAAAVVSALQHMAATVVVTESSPLALALVRFLRLLLLALARCCRHNKLQEQEQKQPIVESFAERLTRVLSANALGARVVLRFLAEHHAEFPDEMLHLPLVRTAARGVWKHYGTPGDFSSLQLMRQVNDAVDVTLQRNANGGNPLALQESDETDLRLQLSVALLRVMRVQAASPDAFLRDAVDIVDRCPVNLSIEYELLVAKVKLLDLFVDDEESCSTIYDDLLQSLRALVELRPLDGDMGCGAAQQEPTEEDKRLQRLHFQEAHRLVVAAFARSHVEERLNQAYTILVTHKYHGLSITKEVAHPLLDVLSRRGDCRVFNIVDLCVLYSGNSVDYETLTYLFRTCRVAGDFYRARTLYQLLREMMPGFLLRVPEAIKEALRELKVLPPEPAHLFPASLADAGGGGGGAAAAEAAVVEGLVDDDLLDSRQRGPIRELPSARVGLPRGEAAPHSTG